MRKTMLALLAPIAMLASATAAQAQSNEPPPAGAIFGLTGEAQTLEYTNYSFSFVANSTNTNLTFAIRNDPAFIQLDDVSFSTGGGANLLTNGDFELGPVGDNAPSGWTYVNQYGAQAAGVVATGCGRSGSNCYFDGAVQAYDAITQALTTTVGTTYDVSFWVSVNAIGGTGFYQTLSDNGNTTGIGGNGINLFVYAQDGVPPPGIVPEPATWALMILGFGATGGMLRMRRGAARRLAIA